MMIIGLAGKAMSGKDTVADCLVDNFGFIKLAFADGIADMLRTGFDVPGRYQLQEKETPIPGIGHSWRRLMQTLGTEWGRSLDPYIWVKRMEQVILRFADHQDQIVISDVRFQNEADWIRQQGTLWHISRPGFNNNTPDHSSEAGIEMQPGEPLIINDGGYNLLYCRVLSIFHAARTRETRL